MLNKIIEFMKNVVMIIWGCFNFKNNNFDNNSLISKEEFENLNKYNMKSIEEERLKNIKYENTLALSNSIEINKPKTKNLYLNTNYRIYPIKLMVYYNIYNDFRVGNVDDSIKSINKIDEGSTIIIPEKLEDNKENYENLKGHNIRICEKENVENSKYENSIILSNGIAVNKSIIDNLDLNTTDRMYLIILMFHYNINNGFAELSINDFLKATNTKNKSNVITILKRLEEKNIIERLNSFENKKGKYKILKHMILLNENSKVQFRNHNNTSIKSNTQDIKDTNSIYRNLGEKTLNGKAILEDINKATNKEFIYINNLFADKSKKIIKETCSNNSKMLEKLLLENRKLCNEVNTYFDYIK